MEMKELIVEGSIKKVYATNQNDQVLVTFNDVISSKGSKKKIDAFPEVNNSLTSHFFEYLESYNVPTHFVRKNDAKSFVAKKVEIIPMKLVVYNLASTALAERFGMEVGEALEFPIVEMYFKDAERNYPMINEYHAYALGLCERKEMTSIMRIATKVNAVLKSFFDRKKLKLVNFQLEFGRFNNQILLADEVSLNTMNIWLIDEKGGYQQVNKDDKKYAQAVDEIASRVLGIAR